MPKFGPVNLRDLVHYFRAMGFDGPYPGGKHQRMVKGELKVTIPNPHKGDNRKSKQVEIYRPDQAVEVLQSPTTLSGETVLLGFCFDLQPIW